jgi:hypothetical protein
MDWENVAVYTTKAPVSFEIWVQEGPTESVTWAYGAIPTAGDPSGLVIGAENRDGTSAQQVSGIPASNSDFTVVAGSPTAGGSVDIHYVANGKRVGSYTLSASMQSDLVPGISMDNVRVRVS